VIAIDELAHAGEDALMGGEREVVGRWRRVAASL
jgi:hypothetical protein